VADSDRTVSPDPPSDPNGGGNPRGKTRSSKKSSRSSAAKVIAFQPAAEKVNAQSVPFDNKGWKRSRTHEGYLIKRIAGYDISEGIYGVSYLFVLSRKPEARTKVDRLKYPFSGFFNWKSLEAAGLLTKERKTSDGRSNAAVRGR
jgi:hypothetical protein